MPIGGYDEYDAHSPLHIGFEVKDVPKKHLFFKSLGRTSSGSWTSSGSPIRPVTERSWHCCGSAIFQQMTQVATSLGSKQNM